MTPKGPLKERKRFESRAFLLLFVYLMTMTNLQTGGGEGGKNRINGGKISRTRRGDGAAKRTLQRLGAGPAVCLGGSYRLGVFVLKTSF